MRRARLPMAVLVGACKVALSVSSPWLRNDTLFVASCKKRSGRAHDVLVGHFDRAIQRHLAYGLRLQVRTLYGAKRTMLGLVVVPIRRSAYGRVVNFMVTSL